MKISFGTNEIKLVRLCKKDDSKAQYRLFKSYSKTMFNIAVRITGNSAEAEDIVQESFIKAFTELENLKNENAFGGWLKRIVINRSLDEIKKRKINYLEIDSINETQINSFNEIDEETDPEMVHHMIKKLPDGAREILVLRAIEGYKHAEIAEKLNISESTSRTQFLRAKQLLGKLIRESDYETGHREISKEKQIQA